MAIEKLDEFCDVKEFAKRTKSSESTVRQECVKKRLPAVKIGKNWRINFTKFEEQFKEAEVA